MEELLKELKKRELHLINYVNKINSGEAPAVVAEATIKGKLSECRLVQLHIQNMLLSELK
mgnify:CR=1 FL=1